MPLMRRAAERTAGLVRATGEEQLELPTPCEKFTVRDLINHLEWVADLFTSPARHGERVEQGPGVLLADAAAPGGGEDAGLGAGPVEQVEQARRRGVGQVEDDRLRLEAELERAGTTPQGGEPGQQHGAAHGWTGCHQPPCEPFTYPQAAASLNGLSTETHRVFHSTLCKTAPPARPAVPVGGPTADRRDATADGPTAGSTADDG